MPTQPYPVVITSETFSRARSAGGVTLRVEPTDEQIGFAFHANAELQEIEAAWLDAIREESNAVLSTLFSAEIKGLRVTLLEVRADPVDSHTRSFAEAARRSAEQAARLIRSYI
ncbi:MAG: hypothetical protein AAGI54_09100 [Planctomycetota bacterium]